MAKVRQNDLRQGLLSQHQKEPEGKRPAGAYEPPSQRALLRRLADETEADEVPGKPLEGEPLGERLRKKLNSECGANLSVAALLLGSSAKAVEAPGLASLTYQQLKDFVSSTDICQALGVPPKSRIAICLKNGPYLATTVLSVMSNGCCLPLDPNSTQEELLRDFTRHAAVGVIVDDPSGAGCAAAHECGIPCIQVVADAQTAGRFTTVLLHKGSAEVKTPAENGSNLRRADTVLVLSTSGTTGQSKAVPYNLETLATGAACVIKSWDLQPEDVCLNMMPLNHVGGIVRNLMGTLFSGGRIVCLPAFDPVGFWSYAQEYQVTWYYAAPAMHNAILQAVPQDLKSEGLKMRMICNAAGGLPPSIAKALRERFGCSVLPSYGMSECMPISSPPTDFDELAPTTSGKPCGPQLAIMNSEGVPVDVSVEGNIVLRGSPVMAGYEQKEANDSCWFNGGWFITGDLGKLNEKGWLEVTGRTKEVIKRGGETLSPMEVEEAVLKHLGSEFKEVAAFAIKDSDFGENIALAVVMRAGKPRLGLPALHAALKGGLRPQCWPQAVVHCPKSLPKTHTGKVRRAVLSSACAQITISQDVVWRERMFLCEEFTPAALPGGIVPPSQVRMVPMAPRDAAVTAALQPVATQCQTVTTGKTRVSYILGAADKEQIKALLATLDDIDKPDALVQMKGSSFPAKLPAPEAADFFRQDADFAAPETAAEQVVCGVWATLLKCDTHTLSRDADFFEVGGTSLLAGRLANELRQAFGKALPMHMIFASPRLKDLAKAYEAAEKAAEGGGGNRPILDCGLVPVETKEYSSTNPVMLILQLLPAYLLPPLKGGLLFSTFLVSYRYAHGSPDAAELHETIDPAHGVFSPPYILALLTVVLTAQLCFPVIGILLKWLIIGRVRAGRYPLWGQYYIRWWLAKHFLGSFGSGMYKDIPACRPLFLRLLGAKVARGVQLSGIPPMLCECDLLRIESGVQVDRANFKLCAIDGRTSQLLLAPIVIEKDCSFCAGTIITPGIVVPAGTSVGPWTSTHELQDATDMWRKFNRLTHPPPGWCYRYLLGNPVRTIMRLLAWLPLVYVIRLAVIGGWVREEYWFQAAVMAMTQPLRILLFLAVGIGHGVVGPLLYVPMLIVVKWLLIGKFVPGKKSHSGYEKFRYWFMELLLADGDVQEFARLLGPHYAPITLFYKLMGAKVGKRIFWPGVTLSIVEYDLLEVGDDVTFGSRSVIVCSDANEAKPVRILAGAMVADNCMLLPGTTLDKNAVLGSGSLGSGYYEPNSISVGNVRGQTVPLRSMGDVSESTLRPFGRAFYGDGKDKGPEIPYYVLGWGQLLTLLMLVRVVWSPLSMSGRGQWAALLFVRLCAPPVRLFTDGFPWMLLGYVVVRCVQLSIALMTTIFLKWRIIGLRQPGIFTWDEATYCQRWKLWTALDGIVMSGAGIDSFGGSFWAVLYYRLLGATIGKNVCLYPWGSSPMMTEPELITVGDNTCVEAGHIVAHVNTYGVFQLAPIKIGNRCTLRDWARVQQGTEMRDGSMLLEHSLSMVGEVVPEGAVWQGIPTRWQGHYDGTLV